MRIEDSFKRHLDEIIANAFYDEGPAKIEQYQNFRIEIIDYNPKTFLGRYYIQYRKIELVNLYNQPVNLAVTLIHEATHHIEYMKYKCCGHQKEFYGVYEKMLYSALDLGKLEPEDFFDRERDSREHNKVNKLISRYEPKPPRIPVRQGYELRVAGGYEVKEKLKEKHFSYDHLGKSWTRGGLTKRQVEQGLSYLAALGIKDEAITIQAENRFAPESAQYRKKEKQKSRIGTLLCTGNTYPYKAALAAMGFRWNKERQRWEKDVYDDEDPETMQAAAESLGPSINCIYEKKGESPDYRIIIFADGEHAGMNLSDYRIFEIPKRIKGKVDSYYLLASLAVLHTQLQRSPYWNDKQMISMTLLCRILTGCYGFTEREDLRTGLSEDMIQKNAQYMAWSISLGSSKQRMCRLEKDVCPAKNRKDWIKVLPEEQIKPLFSIFQESLGIEYSQTSAGYWQKSCEEYWKKRKKN